MDGTSVPWPLAPLEPYLAAASLAVTRMAAMLLVMPAFTRLGTTGIVRTGIALVLALPVIPVVAQAIAPLSLTPGTIAALVAKEAIVGALIGLALGIPLWAAQSAGDILDLQRGASMATLSGPSQAEEVSVSGTLFELTMLALFYASGGVAVAFGVVYDSYALWPAAATLPQFGPSTGLVLLRALDSLITLGLMLAAPLVLALFVTDIVLALLSRAAPNLNVFDLSFSLKSLLFSALLVLYCTFLITYMRSDLLLLEGISRWIETILRSSP